MTSLAKMTLQKCSLYVLLETSLKFFSQLFWFNKHSFYNENLSFCCILYKM